jgi:hypothetical protein
VHARARAIARRWFDKYGFDPFCVPQSALYQPYPSENIDASMVDRMSGAGLASPPGMRADSRGFEHEQQHSAVLHRNCYSALCRKLAHT